MMMMRRNPFHGYKVWNGIQFRISLGHHSFTNATSTTAAMTPCHKQKQSNNQQQQQQQRQSKKPLGKATDCHFQNQSKPETFLDLERSKIDMFRILKRKKGTFQLEQYVAVKRFLKFLHTLDTADGETVTLALNLIDRSMKEISWNRSVDNDVEIIMTVPNRILQNHNHHKQQSNPNNTNNDPEQEQDPLLLEESKVIQKRKPHLRAMIWIGDRRNLNPILNLWKEAAKRNEPVMPPLELLQKLYALTKYTPVFQFDRMSVGILMNVVIHQADNKAKAPQLAEQMLEFLFTRVREEERQNKLLAVQKTDMRMLFLPDVSQYNQVLQAHAISNNPTDATIQSIQKLLNLMKRYKIAPNAITFTILLRFYGNLGDADALDQILNGKMIPVPASDGRKREVPMTRGALAQAIHGYAKARRTETAEKLWNHLVSIKSCNKIEVHLVGESLHAILLAYRAIASDPSRSTTENERAMVAAQAIYDRAVEMRLLTKDEQSRLQNTLMDLYARKGKVETSTISNSIPQSTVELCIMIKSLGNDDQPEKAAELLKRAMQGDFANVEVDLQAFVTLLNAWAVSSKPDAFEQATSILHSMETDTYCTSRGIVPDSVAFACLLKCLLKSNYTDAPERAVRILDDMQQRNLLGKGSEQDKVILTLAIKVHLQFHDTQGAQALLSSMEKRGIHPGPRTYNAFLDYWHQISTPQAAVNASAILWEMKTKKVSGEPLKPDAKNYARVMATWANSFASESIDRILQLHEEMKADNIPLDMSCYTITINHLSKSQDIEHVRKATAMLNEMMKTKETKPDHRHFLAVVKAWHKLEDPVQASRILMNSVNAYILTRQPEMAPNDSMIYTVLRGFVSRNEMMKATMLLDKIQELRDSNLLPSGPNRFLYEYMIDAWERSNHVEKEKYLRLLRVNTPLEPSEASSNQSTLARI